MLGIRLHSAGLLLLALACFSDGAGVESIDVLKPIAKISPARRTGMTDDSFGYSIAVHQLFESPAGMSFEEILAQTRIMVGAPRGAYPGGLNTTEVPPSGLACRIFGITPTTEAEILACYGTNGTHNRTGLVYQCPLSSGSCNALLGDGDPGEPDGLLFDRAGNVDSYSESLSNNHRDIFFVQNKNGQQMGATVHSDEGFFVACAPLWEFTDVQSTDSSQPRGQCVYSGRNLTNFLRLNPCFRNVRNSNQKGEGFCEAGFSVGIITSLNASPDFLAGPVLMTGSPGRNASIGGVYYYNPLGTITSTTSESTGSRSIVFYRNDTSIPLDNSLLGQRPRVNASNAVPPGDHIYNPANLPDGLDHEFSYFGFAISSGYITNQTTKSAVVSAPKNNETTQVGRVYIVTSATEVPTLFIDGDQFGEQFGYALAVTDLNGDGWDDILVGAPVHIDLDRQNIESGRVAIYRNDGTGTGNFVYTGSIFGQSNFGRFGISIATLGDINNDGYNDFAVGAPFEGDGVVYVYHGQDVNGSIVNTTVQQIINGTEVARQVTDLTSGVSSFGFSLTGTTDVDQNQYRDLVVGAFVSQTVFVLRSIPVAVTDIMFSVSVPRVSLGVFNCSFNGSIQNTCFYVTVTSSYIGRGLSSGFSAYYELREVLATGSRARLFFDDPSRFSIRRQITYAGPNETVSHNITVYVKNTTNFNDFILRVGLEQIQRDSSTVDTDVPVTSNFSQSPVIQSQYFEERIPVVRNCGPDGVCISDLVANISDVRFTSEDLTQYNNISVGLVTRVTLNVTLRNLQEDSFNPFLNISFPKAYFSFVPSAFLRADQCSDTAPSDSSISTIICANNSLPNIFTSALGSIYRAVRLDVSSALVGNETNLPVQITVSNTNQTFSREDINDNNDVERNLSVVAISHYSTQIQWSLREIDYTNTGSSFSNNIASTLGPALNITASVRIDEGAQITSGSLTIYIPATTNELGSNYYFYPARIVNMSSNVNCSDSQLNPRDFTLSNPQMVSRRRSVNSGSGKEHSTLRKRQTTAGLACTATDVTGCIPVECNFTSLSREINIIITGYLDERFYDGKTATYNLTTFARVDVTDGFTITSLHSETEASSIISLIGPPEDTPSSSIPWYIIVAPILATIIFFIIVVILLYFLGFFRRKKHGKVEITGDEEFEQFAPNPFGAGGGGGGGAPSAPPKDDEEKS